MSNQESQTATSRLIKEINTLNALDWWVNNPHVYEQEKQKIYLQSQKK